MKKGEMDDFEFQALIDVIMAEVDVWYLGKQGYNIMKKNITLYLKDVVDVIDVDSLP